MERRKFLKILGTTATGAVIVQLGGCGLSVATGNGNGQMDDLVETTTIGIPPSDSHTHTVTIPGEDLDSPPATDKTYTSSSVSGHSHQVTLTPADFETILNGDSLNKNTTSAGAVSHYHNVDFLLA